MVIVNYPNANYTRSFYVYGKHRGEIVIFPHDIKNNELYTDGTDYRHVFANDPIVSDVNLIYALHKLAQYDSGIELYYAYLEMKYPTYTYH